MLVKTLQVLVHAEHDTIWKVMEDRLEHPERYAQGITEARIVERSDNVIVREMKEHGQPVKERVVIKFFDSEMDHELLEHPQQKGKMVLRIVRTARQSPVAPNYLEWDLELDRKSFKVERLVMEEDDLLRDLESELHKMKMKAEEMESMGQRGRRPSQ